MKKARIVGLVVATLTLTACANVPIVKLNSSVSASLGGKSMVIVNHKIGPFVAMTAGKAGFGLLGAAGMYSAGQAQMIKYDIKDPATRIRETLVKGLKAEYNLKIVRSNLAPLENRSVSSVIRAYKSKADYILDYRTFEMGYIYYPTKWGRYKVRYLGKFRLINSKTKKVIASSSCVTFQGNDKNPPTKQQLFSNNAEKLKKYLARARIACSKLLTSRILGLK